MCAIVRPWSSHFAAPSSAWISPIAPHAVGSTKNSTIAGADASSTAPKPIPARIESVTESAFWPMIAAGSDHVSPASPPNTAVASRPVARHSW